MSDNQVIVLLAAQDGHFHSLKVLIAAGAELNVRVIRPSLVDSEVCVLTGLGIGKEKGRSEIVRLLEAKGAK